MFTITQRQYDLIMKQAQACYPQESGGMLGGKEDVILGVLPVFNQFLYDKTKTFGMTADDLDRGYRFFEKNKMKFYGIYHSHPKGIPYPSEQDLSHNQKYLFIIGLADRFNPELVAWEMIKGEPVRIPIQVVDEEHVRQMVLTPDKPKLSDAAPKDQIKTLRRMIIEILEGKVDYPKDPPKWDSSSFSTTA